LCHQNGDLDDLNADILESKNQIVESLVQELTYSASLNEGEIDISETSKQDMVPGFTQNLSDLLIKQLRWAKNKFYADFIILIADGKIKDKTARSKI